MHEEDILLFWMQWSGKGTQAKLLSKKYWFAHFETGAALRKKSLDQDELWQSIKKTIEDGNLVSDQIIVSLVNDFLEGREEKERVIFDGVIRKESQLKSVLKLLKEKGRKNSILVIDFDRATALTRIRKRKTCKKCDTVFKGNEEICPNCGGVLEKRNDDNDAEALMNRIDNYCKKTVPTINFFKDNDYPFLEVNGRKSIKEVFWEIENWLKMMNIL